MKEYQICGKRIVFPFKPYPSQFLLISAILKALDKGDNALLESPTGSGKSLALLCASLAWQKAERTRLLAEFHAEQAAHELAQAQAQMQAAATATGKPKPQPAGSGANAPQDASTGESHEFTASLDVLDQFRHEGRSSGLGQGALLDAADDDDDDFMDASFTIKHSKQHQQESSASSGSSGSTKQVNSAEKENANIATAHPHHDQQQQTSEGGGEQPLKRSKHLRPKRPPKIFFASRTHKQLEQITKELGRSAYRDVHMTVLSSREQTCIHPRVSKSPAKNEECKLMLEQRAFGGGGSGCAYYNNAQKLASRRFRTQSWDLEDLVSAGKRIRGCPYYASREMLPSADIVFCPYNYLIDPVIRSTMDINPANAIIILDEAHNIEDVARDSASTSLTVEALESAITDLQGAHGGDGSGGGAPILYETTGARARARAHEEEQVALAEHVQRLTASLRALVGWAKQEITHPACKRDYQTKNRVFGASEAVASLSRYGIVPGTPSLLQESFNQLFKDTDDTWVGTLSTGPTGQQMLGTFKQASSFAYQDDLGRIITECCKCVGGGVLVFLPSYSALDRLVERWRLTHQFHALNAVKRVFVEPRSGSKDDFDELLADFYNHVSTGAVFFAVCRGKASEGIDFSNERARLVVTVGIPFPNIKDLKVNMKKAYNDANSQRGLLRGAEWYDIQAFRALNQALGRCIRHRLDWGGLLMVDSRFRTKSKYVQSLSKWIRQRVHQFPTLNEAATSLNAFTSQLARNPPAIKPKPPRQQPRASSTVSPSSSSSTTSTSSSTPSTTAAAMTTAASSAGGGTPSSLSVKQEPGAATMMTMTTAPLGKHRHAQAKHNHQQQQQQQQQQQRSHTPKSEEQASLPAGGFMPAHLQSQP
ncbi:hypothetical protein PTSG_09876 [Salpingoeca rosetta]|uniref:DNA 5'-3' helicase FANCJ n=1 Tax=Salpingoeca rosetta (strain ATCC 50818 / BSB-021) TaxID=946362 RepID=F2UND9_SALR5|nr:uncharacterized protein PTSG_09876 [Salpingoeca rosetta]EGD79144.1 hypothetical protein PTSG_09876 [Salpingoeca rosetta]|eukprot:XP_004989229.1 hypothetical protein PTSG_09876 [Salpingoeca rosetta]